MSVWTTVTGAAKTAAGQIIPGVSEITGGLKTETAIQKTEGQNTKTNSATVNEAVGNSATALLTIGVELGAVALFAIIADTSDGAANIMMVVMLGLWIMWAIQNSGAIAGASNLVSKL
jgi:hypothetical protein